MTSQFQHEMRIVSLINDAQIIERILRHLGQWERELWNNGVRIAPSTGPPTMGVIERGQLVIERGLTIRCRTMTAIHRSGRCDKRDKESRRGCRMEPFRSLPLREHRRGQGSRRKPLRSERAKVANVPQCRQTFVLQHRIVTLIARNRRFTVDLSGARPRHLKSEFLSIIDTKI